MEFGKHIGKGLWAFADKTLPVIYGIGFVFLVIRVLPESEYGAFVVIQAIFTLFTSIGTAFAIQPLIKFASETEDYGSIFSVSFAFYLAFLLIASALIITVQKPLALLLEPSHAAQLQDLMWLVPLLFLSSCFKSLALGILQTRFHVQKIFWIDATFFLGCIVGFYFVGRIKMLGSAKELILITAVMHLLSSIVAFVVSKNLLQLKHRPSRETFSKVWHFGKFSFASSVSFAVFAQLDVFLLSSLAGVVHVAVYSAAKIFTRVFDVFNQVVQLFVIPATARLNARGEATSLQVMTEKSIWFSTLVLLPLLALFLFGSDLLISFFYKGRYAEAVLPLRILSLLALTTPWHSVLSSILVGMGKVREGLHIGWLFIAASVVLYFLLIPRLGAVGAATATVAGSIVLSVSIGLFVNKFIPIHIGRVIGRTSDITNFVRQQIAERFK